MQSFALWYEKRNLTDTEKATVVLNFNLWTECKWENSYFDIGIKVDKLKLINKINFFFPFEINENKLEIMDLGRTLKEANVTSAIFNENYSVTEKVKGKLLDVSNIEKQIVFSVYELDICENIDLEKLSDGTLLSIKIKGNPSLEDLDTNVYFRFRIAKSDFNEMIHKYSANKGGLQNLINSTSTVDFRLNNVRSLNSTLLEKIEAKNNNYFDMKSIHFLLMTKSHVQLQSSGYMNARKLESDIWNEYVEFNSIKENTEDIIAYHYKYNFDKSKDYDLFVKYTVEKTVFWKYFWCTILLGALGSILGNIISKIPYWLCQLVTFIRK